MKNIIATHNAMVLRLGKPGEAILKTLTPWDCNLTHMGGCLMGEAAELYDAILLDIQKGRTGDSHDLIEELGDFAFYLVAVRAIFRKNWTGEAGGIASPVANGVQLMIVGGHFWDVIKRIVVYRKDPLAPDSKYGNVPLATVAAGMLNQMEQHFGAILNHYGFTLDEVLEANWTKLADADKGRYGSSYSDEKAQDRRDKQGRE
jgi:hypothetical protein